MATIRSQHSKSDIWCGRDHWGSSTEYGFAQGVRFHYRLRLNKGRRSYFDYTPPSIPNTGHLAAADITSVWEKVIQLRPRPVASRDAPPAECYLPSPNLARMFLRDQAHTFDISGNQVVFTYLADMIESGHHEKPESLGQVREVLGKNIQGVLATISGNSELLVGRDEAVRCA